MKNCFERSKPVRVNPSKLSPAGFIPPCRLAPPLRVAARFQRLQCGLLNTGHRPVYLMSPSRAGSGSAPNSVARL
jgi:hypothetical protein